MTAHENSLPALRMVYKSLHRPLTLCGVERRLFFLALLVGVLVYVALMWRMTGESVLAAVLATIALGILFQGAMVLVFGTQTQHPLRDLGWHNASLAVGGSARISGVGSPTGTYLKPGDSVRATIAPIGSLENPVEAEDWGEA